MANRFREWVQVQQRRLEVQSDDQDSGGRAMARLHREVPGSHPGSGEALINY